MCAIRPKVLNAPTLLGRYFIGLGKVVYVCAKERESRREGGKKVFITELFIESDRILCKLCVCVQLQCGNHAQRAPLRNVVKTTPALEAATTTIATAATRKQSERNGTLETICSFVIVIEDFGLVNKYDPLHCISFSYCCCC